QRFKMAQGAIRAPLFGQFYDGAAQIAVKLLQLLLKTGKQRERIGRATRETRDNLVVIKPADFARLLLHHTFAHRHLAITAHGKVPIPAYTEDGRAANSG